MADFGVTPQGYNKKSLNIIKTEIEQTLRDGLGKGINLLPEELFGQIVGIFSEREALDWEREEAVYLSQYPDSAEDVNLDNVASITGSERRKPIASTVSEQLFFGTIGTIIGPDKIASVLGSPLARFKTLSSITLIAGTNETQKINFDGDADSGGFKINFRGEDTVIIAFNATAATVQSALEALSTIGIGNISVIGVIDQATGLSMTFLNPGPDGLGLRSLDFLLIVDNTLLEVAVTVTPSVVKTITGVPQGAMALEAETTGPTDGPTGAISVIETPVTGWDSTVNTLDALLGQNVESDPEFRIRRKQEVARSGSTTIPGIFSDLINIDAVTAVVVFQNNLDIIDLDGRPPHSVDIVIEGGDEDELAIAVFNTVAGGITMIGDISKTVKDPNDFDQIVKFSRPTSVPLYTEVDLSTDPDLFPIDGLAQVEALILIYGNSLLVGQNVVVRGSNPSLICSFEAVPGILDIVIRIGKTAAPALDDNIIIAPREVSNFDSSRITAAEI